MNIIPRDYFLVTGVVQTGGVGMSVVNGVMPVDAFYHMLALVF